jgi:hypothetical protein
MVQFSSEIPVKSREVLAVGPQSVPVIETVLITLAHLSVHSEEVEFEVCLFSLSQSISGTCVTIMCLPTDV